MSKPARARDRQRLRARIRRQLQPFSTGDLIDELVRRSGIGTGYIKIEIRDLRFASFGHGEKDAFTATRPFSRARLDEVEALLEKREGVPPSAANQLR